MIDGTDSPTETASIASQLGKLGYRVLTTSVSRDVGPVAETTVLYNGRAHLEQAEKVMSSLSGAVVLGQGTPAGGADVSVVTGSILSVAKPTTDTGAASQSHSTAGGSNATSTTAATSSSTPPTTTNPNIGAPTSANPTIPPWDARSCPTIPAEFA